MNFFDRWRSAECASHTIRSVNPASMYARVRRTLSHRLPSEGIHSVAQIIRYCVLAECNNTAKVLTPRYSSGIVLLLLGIVWLTSGCASNSKPIQPKKKPVDAEEAKAARPGAITGKGWKIRWRKRDPNHPAGSPIPVLYAESNTGSMADEDDNVVIQLNDVHARLFQDGRQSAIIYADQMDADQHDKVIIGTGRVKVKSITSPPDTVVTADKITWDTDSHKIVAEGNARVVRHPKIGAAFTHEGGTITFDLGLKEFEIK